MWKPSLNSKAQNTTKNYFYYYLVKCNPILSDYSSFLSTSQLFGYLFQDSLITPPPFSLCWFIVFSKRRALSIRLERKILYNIYLVGKIFLLSMGLCLRNHTLGCQLIKTAIKPIYFHLGKWWLWFYKTSLFWNIFAYFNKV